MKALTTLLLMASPALFAGEMDLLNGHLSITLPDEAVYGQRSTDLMGPGPGDTETLVWVGEGSRRVAVYAREFGAYATEDFAARQREKIRKGLGDKGFEIAERPGIVYALATQAPKRPSGADLLATANIRHEDGTVQRVDFIFAQDRAKDIDACRQFAQEAIASIRPGKGALNLAAREERLLPIDEEGNFVLLPLPEGCFATHSRGADFLYNSYHSLRPQDEPASGLSVYLGHHPRELEGAEETRTGSIAGKPVEWQLTQDEEGYYAECLVQLTTDDEYARHISEGDAIISVVHPDRPDGLFAHLMVYADSVTERDEHIRRAGQLSIGKPSDYEQKRQELIDSFAALPARAVGEKDADALRRALGAAKFHYAQPCLELRQPTRILFRDKGALFMETYMGNEVQLDRYDPATGRMETQSRDTYEE